MTAAELVRTDNVNNEIPEATALDVLDDEVAAKILLEIGRCCSVPKSLHKCL